MDSPNETTSAEVVGIAKDATTSVGGKASVEIVPLVPEATAPRGSRADD